VLQRVAACCSVLQRVAACCKMLQRVVACCSVLQRVAACCIVMACCSVLQCVAVCCRYCSVLQCVAVCCRVFLLTWHVLSQVSPGLWVREVSCEVVHDVACQHVPCQHVSWESWLQHIPETLQHTATHWDNEFVKSHVNGFVMSHVNIYWRQLWILSAINTQ